MNIIFILIIVSLFMAIVFLILFINLVKTGQYDDVYTPSVRMLFEDEIVENKNKKINEKKQINN
ncbi:MAG: cbb3-type cytochrome oxidase assembly protein CcoS [Bacteroidota bacterium]